MTTRVSKFNLSFCSVITGILKSVGISLIRKNRVKLSSRDRSINLRMLQRAQWILQDDVWVHPKNRFLKEDREEEARNEKELNEGGIGNEAEEEEEEDQGNEGGDGNENEGNEGGDGGSNDYHGNANDEARWKDLFQCIYGLKTDIGMLNEQVGGLGTEM